MSHGKQSADAAPPVDVKDPKVAAAVGRYWRANVAVMAVLLTVWAGVSLGCSVLLADVLNAHRLPGTGFPLGFWFAQQGSIITFVLVILAYCLALNRLDRRHHAELARLAQEAGR